MAQLSAEIVRANANVRISVVTGQQSASFAQMLKLQQLTQGTSLIGKTVEYTPTGGAAAAGQVSAVAVQNGNVVLAVGSATVPLDQVTLVTA